MTIKPFIIQCADREDCRKALRYLVEIGYGIDAPECVSWADAYKDYWTIGVHSNGRKINTRPSLDILHRDIPSTRRAIFFPSFHVFLTSNRHIDTSGNPLAYIFSRDYS